MKEYKQLGAYGLVILDGRILLIKKSGGPYDKKLDLPGGTIEFCERPVETLKRELMEEVGIEVIDSELFDADSVSFEWQFKEDILVKVHHTGIFYKILNYKNEIKKELDFLKLEKRPEVILALKEARAQGDLSENSEYDAARNEQALVESKIAELEKMVENAVVIKEVDTDKVSIGTSVKIEYVDDGETESYMVVGSKEADPFENKISNESPIAQAIMGKKIGDVVSVASPNGQYSVKILEIA